MISISLSLDDNYTSLDSRSFRILLISLSIGIKVVYLDIIDGFEAQSSQNPTSSSGL